METRKAFAQFFMRQPEFQQWKASNPSHDDWGVYEAYENAHARLGATLYALAYVWPDFVEIDGLILRDRGWSREDWRQYLQQWRDHNLSPREIEATVNHIHIWDMFLSDPDRQKFDQSIWISLAQTIAEIWRCRLGHLFPDQEFEVGVYDGYGPEVYAFTIRGDVTSAASFA